MSKPGYLLILFFICSVVGCATERPAPEPPAPLPMPGPGDLGQEAPLSRGPLLENRRREAYVIGPGDSLDVSVWRHQDAAASVTVDYEGNISLPIIGVCKAEGFTPGELTRNIAGRLSRYFQDPQVRLVVSRYYNRRVYLLGEFANPGMQFLEGNETLLDLIAAAGGVKDTADLSRLTVVRGRGMMIRIDFNQLLAEGNMDLNINIHPNDLVYLPDDKMNQVYVFGEIDRPGIYTIHPGYTALEAVMAAGGPTEDAALSRTRIYRGSPFSPEEFDVDLRDILRRGDRETNVPLRPQDIVYVPSRFAADFNYYVRQVLPSLQTIILTDRLTDVLNLY